MACKELTRKGLQCSREGKYSGCCSQHLSQNLDMGSKGIKLKQITKASDGKHKYMAIFSTPRGEKKTYFGAEGYGDFIIFSQKNDQPEHHRELYWDRHTKDLHTMDPTSAGYLSLFVLWNKPTLQASIADYKKRFNL